MLLEVLTELLCVVCLAGVEESLPDGEEGEPTEPSQAGAEKPHATHSASIRIG